MQILIETEEDPAGFRSISCIKGVRARKLPPDYEPKGSFSDNGNFFKEHVVELEDYRPEDFNRDREWKKIQKELKRNS